MSQTDEINSANAKLPQGEICYIRAKHPEHFRTGEWALLLNVRYVENLPYFVVCFPDGILDQWEIYRDVGYEFCGSSQMQAQRDQEDARRYRLLRDCPDQHFLHEALSKTTAGAPEFRRGKELDKAVDALWTKAVGKRYEAGR